MSLAKNRVAVSFAIIAFLLIAGVVAIFWARGFKPDFKDGRIERTGLIVATSIPTGAQVYLDDRLTSATNTNIAFLDPKTYKVKIEKDGYTTWQKDIEVKADLATEIKAALFPLAPEIKPLTTSGAASPSLSPDGTKIVYGVTGQRGGLYLLTMSDRPLPFRQDNHQLAKNKPDLDYTKAVFLWSPDSTQIIARFAGESGQTIANLLVDAQKSDQEPRDITGSLNATLATWQEEITTRAQTQAVTVPDEIKAATAEAQEVTSDKLQVTSQNSNLSLSTSNLALNYYPSGLVFSPDEEKILYQDKNGRHQIYDLKLKKTFTLTNLPDLLAISWYPDSAHLVVAQKDLISIIETDGNNKMNVYSGKFENNFVFAHPSGTRLIILTTLTQTEGTPTNLYSINLR